MYAELSTAAMLALVALQAFAFPPGALRVSGPFPSIRAAVDASGSGAVLCVARRTYQENVQLLTSGLTNIGEGASPADLVIETQGPDGACRDATIFVNAANVPG